MDHLFTALLTIVVKYGLRLTAAERPAEFCSRASKKAPGKGAFLMSDLWGGQFSA
jgi:hypothetical protein